MRTLCAEFRSDRVEFRTGGSLRGAMSRVIFRHISKRASVICVAGELLSALCVQVVDEPVRESVSE